MSLRLLDALATTEPLAEVFSDAALVTAMLRFETALAQAQARARIIPQSAADAIARAADAGAFDAAAIARAARASGTIAIPFVEQLTARVRTIDAAAATFVHWGATSQDVTDTALVLCLANAARIFEGDRERLSRALRQVSDEHARTPMLARTLLQPAPPVTFGLKAAGWLAAVERAGSRLRNAFVEACVLQFGGASGTLAALGPHGPSVAADLARALDLSDPGAPWHSHRDRLAALVSACGVLAGTLGKMARDIALLMQAEVGEAAEPGGGSSSMPHKRNPAGCAAVLAAATRVPALVSSFLSGMVQEQERGLGGWHAEGPTLAAAVQATGAALAAMAEVAERLTIWPERMRENLAATRGVIFAERAMVLLAPVIGREAAGRAIGSAIERTRQGDIGFAAALAGVPEAAGALPASVFSTLETPEEYLGAAEEFRRRQTGSDRGQTLV